MTDRALTFGSDAAAYDRFRPGYPDALAAAVLQYAGRPVRTALEIGAGTGKATRLFTAHGVAVTATDPDAAMLAELQKHAPLPARVVLARFEDLTPTDRFDLVFAGAALHWTSPQQRWTRIARLLAPGGVVAVFGGPTRVADPDLEAAVRAARSPWLLDDEVPPPEGPASDAAMRWPGDELERSEHVTDVRQLTIPRRLTYPADDVVGLLSTISAYRTLDDRARRDALAAIRRVLPPEVDLRADIDVHLARRTEDAP